MRILHESFGATIEKVDKENHVLRGVKLIGLDSPSRKRKYKEDALRKAVPLYEGASINIGHVDRTDKRHPGDVLGQTRNVKFVEGKGNFGDVHLIPGHPMTQRMEWIAENMPNVLAMSHAAGGMGSLDAGGIEIIEEILNVVSVDVVVKGGTTKGLFESELAEGEVADRLALRDRMEAIHEVNSTAWSLIWEAFYGEGNPTERTNKITAVLKDWESELGSIKEDADMQIKDLTLTQLREDRQDLVEELGRSSAARIAELDAENKVLKGKLDGFEAADKLRTRNAARKTVVEAAKLDPSLVTKGFTDLVEDAATTDESFTKLVEDRKAVNETLKARPAVRSSAKDLREQAGRTTEVKGPKTVDEFAGAVKAG